MNWLFKEHPTRRSALEVAVRQDFAIKDDDEFVSQTLRDAYTDLQQSKDPAVIYFLRTLAYLPKGSQIRNPDVVPEVEWFSQDQTRGMVVTPAGTHLGFVEKLPDGAWEITPLTESSKGNAIAQSVADAKHYLVGCATDQVAATINGQSKQLHILSGRDFFPPPVQVPDIENSADPLHYTLTYELEFWDSGHGISHGMKSQLNSSRREATNLYPFSEARSYQSLRTRSRLQERRESSRQERPLSADAGNSGRWPS